jgi:hypothetical protein
VRRARLALAPSACLVAGLALAAPQADRPLGVTTPGTWRNLFLDLPLADARPGAEPDLCVRWWLANDWSVPTRLTRAGRTVEVQQDEQADALTVAARIPWSRRSDDPWHRFATALEWRALAHWGGYTDRLIEGWHRLGGFNDFERPLFPRDAVHLILREPGGATALALLGPRLTAGDLVVRTSAALLEGEAPAGPYAVAARLDAKLPVGQLADAGGSGGLDVGTALALSLPVTGWLTVHLQGTAARISPLASAVPLEPRRLALGAEASLAFRLGSSTTLLLESRIQSAVFERGWRPADPVQSQGDAVTAVTRTQNQVTLGARLKAITFWLSEDFTPGRRAAVGWRWFYDTNAPDLVLGVAVALP